EGGVEIKGKRRPRAFGKLSASDGQGGNVTPTLVIAGEGLWQVNDGPVTSINAVRDGGIPLDFVADYATVALLRAALTGVPSPIPAGKYGTCIAQGYFGAGGSGFKQITCDVTGVNLTTADIIKEVALSSAGLASSQLDAFTFEDLNTAQPAQVAYFL